MALDLLSAAKNNLEDAQQQVQNAADAAVAKITGRRAFGPILHFRNRTEAGEWIVVASAGADEDCAVQLKVETPINHQQPSTFSLEGGSNPKAFVFSQVAMKITQQQQRQAVTYSCKFGDGEEKSYTFVVPAIKETPRILYFSCNDLPLPEHREAHASTIYNAWQWIHGKWLASPEKAQGAEGLHLMLGGGDNIYADQILKIALLEKKDDLTYGDCLDFYISEYIRRFSTDDVDAAMKHALATVPSFMQCDDHDYYNGFGSYTDARRPSVFVSKAAHVTRLAFQIGTQSSAEIRGDVAVLDDQTRVARLSGTTTLFSMDMRSTRDSTKNQLMDLSIFDAKLKELEKLCSNENTHHMIVLFASPPIWLHDGFTELFANVKKHIPGLSIFATDAFDVLRSCNNKANTTYILHKLLDLANRNKIRMTFVSGDVHTAGLGSLKAEGLTDPKDFRHIQNWISSPICNIADEDVGEKLLRDNVMKKSITFSYDSDPTVEKGGKINCELSDVWIQKNFLVIDECASGSKNLQGQLYVNASAESAEYVPLPNKWVATPATITKDGSGCCSLM